MDPKCDSEGRAVLPVRQIGNITQIQDVVVPDSGPRKNYGDHQAMLEALSSCGARSQVSNWRLAV